MKYKISASIALGIILLAGTAWAHHSNNRFEPVKRVTLTGTLTKLDWRNPHIQFSLEVKGDQGQAESWLFEGPTPSAFRIRNLGKSDFEKAIGQTVTVEANPARDGSRHGSPLKITFPDGRVVATGF